MSEIEEKVSNLFIKASEDDVSSLMLDILRILSVFHGVLWKTEISQDLIKFYKTLGEPEIINPKMIDIAIKNLEEMGLIKIEQRVRGMTFSTKTYQDLLIHLIDKMATRKILQKDEKYRKYILERERTIREALDESR